MGPTLFGTKGVATVSGVLWTSAAWIHNQSQSIIFVRNNAFDRLSTIGSYYVGWLKTSKFVTFFDDTVELNAEGFSWTDFMANLTTCVQVGYVDVYCAASISDCKNWVERFRGKTFEIRSPGWPQAQWTATFESPQLACTTCSGIHSQEICPVQASEVYPVVGTRKHGHDEPHVDEDDESSHAKRSRIDVEPSDSFTFGHTLERKELASKILERVARDHLILVSFQ